MPSTTPLAPWNLARKLVIIVLLLTATACGSKQYSTKQNLADTEAGTPQVLADVEPSSPFSRYTPGQPHRLSFSEFDPAARNPFQRGTAPTVSMPMTQRMVALAYSQIGTLYHSGGVEPATGFDCSGFTSWVFNKIGINLPRSSGQQFQEGKVIAKSQLRKGDLVFFGNKKRITHVGIYLENNMFIHSSSSGDTVKISSLDDPTWERKYTGARRIF